MGEEKTITGTRLFICKTTDLVTGKEEWTEVKHVDSICLREKTTIPELEVKEPWPTCFSFTATLENTDVIAKFNREGDLFDPNHPRYRAAAQKALDALLDTPAVLEVNTGAISRGYTTEPYPAQAYLRQWLAAGKEIIFASDCHSKEHLLYGYDIYEAWVQEINK